MALAHSIVKLVVVGNSLAEVQYLDTEKKSVQPTHACIQTAADGHTLAPV
jgi:hypothetical protein